MNQKKTLRIVFPSGTDPYDLLSARIQLWEEQGFRVLWEPHGLDPDFDFLAGSPKERALALWQGLTETKSGLLLAGRGGYGASDLLPLIPWGDLKAYPPKWVVGFSDFSAILSALYAKGGWKTGIHGPMAASNLWEEGCGVLELLGQDSFSGSLPLAPLAGTSAAPQGVLRGGCLSVLSQLLGTPYLPPFKEDTILFFEDVGETPGRVLRSLTQWFQVPGMMARVRGVVLGNFQGWGDSSLETKEALARRFPMDFWSTEGFGHITANHLIPQGGWGRVTGEGVLQFGVSLEAFNLSSG
jgi:muramoyltetrapeptide carboxypeptidase